MIRPKLKTFLDAKLTTSRRYSRIDRAALDYECPEKEVASVRDLDYATIHSVSKQELMQDKA